MPKPVGYSIKSYGEMITDHPRMRAYAAALKNAVKPGSVVIDIGAGTGIFTLLACRFGAASVTAIEPNPAIHVARTTVNANDFTDCVRFFQGLSTDLTVDQRADVIVSDLRGILPLLQFHIPSIVDARERLLKLGGTLIPQRDTIWATVVDVPRIYESFSFPWTANKYDFDLTAGHALVVNQLTKIYIEPEQMLSIPKLFANLDYYTITNPNVAATLSWSAERQGVAHGLCLWFDADLFNGIGFSNAPGKPELIYGHEFLPFENAVAIDAGDRIEANIRANLVNGDYVWSWHTQFYCGEEKTAHTSFHQSTFKSSVIEPSALKRRASTHAPAATISAEIDVFCLSQFDGKTTLESIARELVERYPARFSSWKNALDHVAAIGDRYYVAKPEIHRADT